MAASSTHKSQISLESRLRQFQRTNYSAGFISRLFVLRGRIRVGDDPRACLHVRAAVLDEHRANGDAEIQITGEIEVPDCSGVDATPAILQFRDDLHRAY